MTPNLIFNIFPVANGMRAREHKNTTRVKFGCPETALFLKKCPESATGPINIILLYYDSIQLYVLEVKKRKDDRKREKPHATQYEYYILFYLCFL